MPNPESQFAPAKLNLYLHVTGRRSDGYHDLDSLAAFAGIGDEVRLESASAFDFALAGPQAAALAGADTAENLVVKAAQSLAELTGHKLDVKLTLTKQLPVASGIGGGSSDAAAALRLLARHWGLSESDPRLVQAAARHGQDVPLCLTIRNAYLTATGTAPGPELPHADIVLVNPNKGLPTPAVYKNFRESGDPFTPAAPFEAAPATLAELVAMLQARRNDLTAAACRLLPEIAAILAALEQTPGCLLSRMSGSGATCFGIYTDRGTAKQAASALLEAHPDWWVAGSFIPFLAPQSRHSGKFAQDLS